MKTPAPPQLDPALLSSAVQAAGLAGQISGRFEAHFVGRFSNDVWRLDLEEGPSLIAKQPFRSAPDPEQQDVERLVYRFLRNQKDLNPAVPRYLGELNGCLLLEYQPLQPFTFEASVPAGHATRAIDALADWHAAWWGRAPEAEWLPRLDDPELLGTIARNYDRVWTERGNRLLESAPGFRRVGDALVGRLAATLPSLAEPATFIHGDAHAENLPLTREGKVLILDWQEPRVANPGYDLAVFTSMSFRHQDRAGSERQLVERHAKRLARAGCHWPDPWADYRLGMLRRVARIVEIADADFPSLPWVFRRTAMAALELDSGSLIR